MCLVISVLVLVVLGILAAIVYVAYSLVRGLSWDVFYEGWRSSEDPEAYFDRYYEWVHIAPAIAAVLTVVLIIVLIYVIYRLASKKSRARGKVLDEEEEKLYLSDSSHITTYKCSDSTYRIIFDDVERILHYIYFKDPYAKVLEPRSVVIPYANINYCVSMVYDELAEDELAGLKNFASGFIGGAIGGAVAGKKGMMAGALLSYKYYGPKRVVSRIELVIGIHNCNIEELRIEVFNSHKIYETPHTDADSCSTYIKDAERIEEKVREVKGVNTTSSTQARPITIEL